MTSAIRISFIGGGNMAAALIGGMVERGHRPADIQVVELSAERGEWLVDRFGVRVCAAPDAALLDCDILLLAVKPQQMREALAPLAGSLRAQIVVSIAAGLRIADIGRWLGGYTGVVRAMPNTPSLIGAGITGLCADPSVSADGRAAAERVLASVGSILWVEDEAKMDALTAVSGSGPAYVFHFIEALEAAALAVGFNTIDARRLAIETVSGAARLAVSSDEPPGVLRERVTSKGGTTAAALEVLMSAGLTDIVVKAVVAAETRAGELGDQLGRG